MSAASLGPCHESTYGEKTYAQRFGKSATPIFVTPKGKGNSPLAGLSLISVLLAASLLVSCAGSPSPRPIAEPLAILSTLDPSALAYFRLDGEEMRVLAPALLHAAVAPGGARPVASMIVSATALAKRTRNLGFAILGGRDPVPASLFPRFEAVLEGDFSRLGLGWSLLWNREWEKSGKDAWLDRGLGIAIAAPSSGILLAASKDVSALETRSKSVGVGPLPSRFFGLGSADLLCWLPDPIHRLGPMMGGGAVAEMKVPLLGMLVVGRLGTATALDGEDEAARPLSFKIVALMKDAESARIYLPALRFAWAFLSRGWLLPVTGASIADFSRDGDTIVISGLSAKPAVLAALLLGVDHPADSEN